MNPLFVCKVRVHISMIVILKFSQDNFVLNLVPRHEKILLNLLNHDLRFDIVFVLNFDHYHDLIPILNSNELFKDQLKKKQRTPERSR